MNHYWLKVSLVVAIIVDIALAASLFYQNKGGLPIDESRLPSVIAKLEKGFKTASDVAKRETTEGFNKVASQFEKLADEFSKLRAETDKKVQDLRQEINKRK